MASINPFLPVQEGTGTPSPENVRPIKPAVSIAGGKNLLNPNGNWTVGNVYRYIKFIEEEQICNMSFVLKDSSINISDIYIGFALTEATSAPVLNNGYRWCIEKGSIKSVKTNTVYYPPATAGQLCTYCVIYPSSQDVFDRLFAAYDIQIELGSEPTEYEPYQSLDIYGGYLDIANAKIVQTMVKRTIVWGQGYANENTFDNNTLRWFSVPNTAAHNGQQGNNVCDKAHWFYKYGDDSIHFYTHERGIYLILPHETSASEEITVCYDMAAPITHYLSHTQLAQAMDQLGVKLSSTLMNIRRKILLNSPHLETAYGSVATFDTDMKAKLKECKLHFLPIQEGNGDPSPNNVRPITGWTELTAYKTGKNMIARTLDQVKAFTPTRWTGNVYNYNDMTVSVDTDSNGNVLGYNCTKSVSSGTAAFDIALYKTLSGKTVKLSGSVAGGASGTYRLLLQEFAPENKVLAREYSAGSVTVTIPEDATDVRIRIAVTGQYSNLYFKPMLTVVDETDLTYAYPNPTTIPIAFPSEAGTVYGGYVDLVNGELVQTMGYVHFDESSNWSSLSATSHSQYRYAILRLQPNNGIYEPVVSDKFASYSSWDPYPFYAVLNNGGHLVIGAPDELSTVDALKTWLQEVGGADIAYPLVNPIHYTLTPQQIKTLIGCNNIWSDAGDIEIKYWTHKHTAIQL